MGLIVFLNKHEMDVLHNFAVCHVMDYQTIEVGIMFHVNKAVKVSVLQFVNFHNFIVDLSCQTCNQNK